MADTQRNTINVTQLEAVATGNLLASRNHNVKTSQTHDAKRLSRQAILLILVKGIALWGGLLLLNTLNLQKSVF